MDVYLIPVGTQRYELYCEDVHEDQPAESVVEAQPGMFAGLVSRFKAALARVEHEHRHGGAAPPPVERRSWTNRVKDYVLCWLAEKIAEQRLLWRLRRESEVRLIFPDDLSGDEAMTVVRRMLQRDADRHFRWLIFNGLVFMLTGVVAIVPGPNLLAYYFGFRVVGHYWSRRGAKHGLRDVTWHEHPSPLLARLRQAVALSAFERERHVREVESQLRLQHLTTFFQRTAVPTA
jgi:hypothetical protein